ncbi:MAG: prolyl oligopeptidase family serine peptidase [Cyclobacteriaceae bacterium]
MKSNSICRFLLVSCFSVLVFSLNLAAQPLAYPETPRYPVADTIWGKIVIDDYRWLEEMNNTEVKDWVKRQSDFTNSIFDKIAGRDELMKEFLELDKVKPARYGFFMKKEANRYFFEKTLAGENVGKLYYREGKNGSDILLFDPVAYSNAKDTVVTFDFVPSGDGKMVALLLRSGGQEVATIRVLNVENQKFYAESIYPAGAVTGWTPDHKGFIYSAFQTSNHLSNDFYKDIRAMYHASGTDTSMDKIIFSREHNPDLKIQRHETTSVRYSSDEKYLLCALWGGPKERSFFAPAADLLKAKISWKPFITGEDDEITSGFIHNEKAYLFSKDGTAHYRLSVSPLDKSDISRSKIILSERERRLTYVSQTRDYLFVHSTNGAHHFVDQYNFTTGEISALKFPFGGATYVNTYNVKSNDCFLRVWSRNNPMTIYDYNPVTGETKLNLINSSPHYPGTDDLVVEEVEVPGHDGVMIPLSITYNKRINKDGSNVVYMTGYGSYGMTFVPSLNILFMPLFNRGVILATTHPRGDGINGPDWHKGGFKATKPNTWKDFISCAEYLIKHGYTSEKRLIGSGTSAGGILIGRAITERPDLFAASLHIVPVSNALRGENRPNGDTDAREFGTVKDSVEAMGLIEMDAYLQIKQGVAYPAVLAVGGINDSRVPVWQPGKFAAAMQRASSSGKPVLLQVNYDSGHITEEKFVGYRNYANMYAFALWQAGHKDFQLTK